MEEKNTRQKNTAIDYVDTYQPDALQQLWRATQNYLQTGGGTWTNIYWSAIREHLFECFQTQGQVHTFFENGALPKTLVAYFSSYLENEAVIRECANDLLWHQKYQAGRTTNNRHTKNTSPLCGIHRLTSGEGYILSPKAFAVNNSDGTTSNYVVHFANAAIPLANGTGIERGFIVISKLFDTPGWDTHGSRNFEYALSHTSLRNHVGLDTRIFLHTPPEDGKESIRYTTTAQRLSKSKISFHSEFKNASKLPVPKFIDNGILETVTRLTPEKSNTQLEDIWICFQDPFAIRLMEDYSRFLDSNDIPNMKKMNAWHIHHTLRRMRVVLHPISFTPLDPVYH